MNNNDIDRINTLYHKAKAVGLTPEEKEEQKRLRKAYIRNIRESRLGTLNNIDMENEDGTVTNLGEKFGKKTSKWEN